MKRIYVKLPAVIVLFCLLVNLFSIVVASTNKSDDVSGHWAETTLRSWIDKDLLKGSNNNYLPNKQITRVEFMTLVNRLYNYSDFSNSVYEYSDLPLNSWYFNEVSKALAAGYIKGSSNTTMGPNNTITREQVFTILTRIKGLNQATYATEVLSEINDSDSISAWAKESVAVAVYEGFVTGNNGSINPLSNITRAEAVVLLDRLKTNTRIFAFPGTYDFSDKIFASGDVVILSDLLKLKNINISGDLTISASVGDGDIHLENVTVDGSVYVNGGGKNSVHFENVTVLDNVEVSKDDKSIVRIIAFGETNLNAVILRTSAILVTQKLTNGGIKEVIIHEDYVTTNTIELAGPFKTITNKSNNARIIMSNAKIDSLKLEAKTIVDGTGTILSAYVSKDAGKGSSIPTKPETIKGEGAPDIMIDGKPNESVDVPAFPIFVPGGGSGSTEANKPPTADAGDDFVITLNKSAFLKGSATDDGLPNGKLTYMWIKVSGPGTVSFENALAVNTSATFSSAGKYVLKLTVSDGSLTSTDTITITVDTPAQIPGLVALYKFDDNVLDSSGNGNDATLHNETSYSEGKIDNALSLNGSGGYAKLNSGIVSDLTEFTISTWLKANTIGTWSRVFDFGTDSSNYMFLTLSAGSYPRYAITTADSGSEQVLNGTEVFTTGVWHHVAITQFGNTTTLYVDGVAVATNSNMTLNPSHLGNTTNNYIGKSQWNDPYLDSSVDDFRIYSKALSALEIKDMYISGGGVLINKAPLVNAGLHSIVTLPSTISLSGIVSDDGLPENSTLTHTWSLLNGPDTAIIDTPNDLNATATVTKAGSYEFKLTASDGALTSSSTVTVTVYDSTYKEPEVTSPPSWIDPFYKKSIMIYGIPICSTSEVPDEALLKAYYVLDAQLKKIVSEKPAIMEQMLRNGVYVIIVGLNETNNMHPSWSHTNDPSWPRRGGGGNPTTILEEDCLVPASDTWRQNFCGLVHEFAHTLLTYGIGDASMPGADPDTYNAIVEAYNAAIAADKYNESDYDRSNYHEYFTGQSNRWFDSNPTDLNVPNASSKTDRQQLEEYDPVMYDILSTLYGDYKLPEPWN